MSITNALNAAVSGLALNQRGMEIASHNIANAQTEGYSRRILQSETADAGGVGARGVRMIGIERVTDTFATQQVRTESATLGRSQVRDAYFTLTQDLFGDISSDSSIGQRLADLTSRMEELAVDPESATAANSFINDAVTFATELNSISQELFALRREADLSIERTISEINVDLELVSDLNGKIATRALTPGADIGDLEDMRDQALQRIGEKINIKTFTRSNGEVVAYTGDARALVDGAAVQLTYTPSGAGSLDAAYDDIARSDGVSIQSDIRDGELKGLLEARDSILPNLLRQFDVLAANARDMANAVHNRGMGLPAAQTLTGSRAFADPATDSVTIGSDVRFAIADASGLAVASFDLPADVYTISDLATAIDAGLGVHGSATITGDGRLVISASNAANGVGMVDLNGGADAAITLNAGAGPQSFEGFSNFFGLNDLFVTAGAVQGDSDAGAASALKVRQDLVSNPSRVSRGGMSATADAPVVGTDRLVAIGDGGLMQEMAAAFSADRNIDAVGGLPPVNKPLHEYAAEIVGLNSQQAADEAERLAFEEALIEQFQTRLTDTAGVNLDEELANILVLQNAFSASARVVTTADEMMEILIGLKR